MSDQERLRAIAEREQQATKGPWFTGPHYKADVHEPGGGVIRANCWQAPQGIADAQFIAHESKWCSVSSSRDALREALKKTHKRLSDVIQYCTDDAEDNFRMCLDMIGDHIKADLALAETPTEDR